MSNYATYLRAYTCAILGGNTTDFDVGNDHRNLLAIAIASRAALVALLRRAQAERDKASGLPLTGTVGEVLCSRRDRFCPSCGDRLGRRLARAVAHKASQCQQVLSIALTRPKVASETPGQALDAMSKACTRLMASPLCRTRSKTAPPPLPGGVRF